jgi:hypothetical protein
MMLAEPEHIEADAIGDSICSMTLAKALLASTGSPVAGSRLVSTKV